MKCTVGSGYEWIYKQLMQLYTLFSWRQATNVVVLTMETHDHIFLHLEQYGHTLPPLPRLGPLLANPMSVPPPPPH